MLNRRQIVACSAALAVSAASADPAAPSGDGVVSAKSAYKFAETLDRIKADIAGKKIMVFDAIDQAKLASDAGIQLRPSTLLLFGNPPLGVQFLTSNPAAGLDWPVRLLVTEDAEGQVWVHYTEWSRISQKYHIGDRDEAFSKAKMVVESIVASVAST